MDEDASGTLSFEEFDRAMMASGQQLDPDTVDKMYRSMDINGSGEVDYLEFLSAAVASQVRPTLAPALEFLSPAAAPARRAPRRPAKRDAGPATKQEKRRLPPPTARTHVHTCARPAQGNIDDRMSTRAAFSLLDHDSDGFINESDLNATCSDFLSPADIKKL